MAEEISGVYESNGNRVYSFGKALMIEPGTPVTIYLEGGKKLKGKKIGNDTLDVSRVVVVEGEDGYHYNFGRHVGNVEIGPAD